MMYLKVFLTVPERDALFDALTRDRQTALKGDEKRNLLAFLATAHVVTDSEVEAAS